MVCQLSIEEVASQKYLIAVLKVQIQYYKYGTVAAFAIFELIFHLSFHDLNHCQSDRNVRTEHLFPLLQFTYFDSSFKLFIIGSYIT